ncbi:MAG: hypothetical protein ABR587_13200 [Candidatus Binatia bacterium]
MFRRLLAAVLAITIAVPFPALAGTGCQMDSPTLAAALCDCCTSPMAASGGCAGIPSQAGCGCALRADTSAPSDSAVPAPSALSTTVNFAVEAARIPAALSTPQRASRAVELAASPPGAGAVVSRPLLCTWTI